MGLWLLSLLIDLCLCIQSQVHLIRNWIRTNYPLSVYLVVVVGNNVICTLLSGNFHVRHANWSSAFIKTDLSLFLLLCADPIPRVIQESSNISFQPRCVYLDSTCRSQSCTYHFKKCERVQSTYVIHMVLCERCVLKVNTKQFLLQESQFAYNF